MSQTAYDLWKEEQSRLQQEAEKRQRVERDDLMLAFDNELGIRTDKNNLLLDGGAAYNPFTGAYSVKNQGGTGQQTDAFYYNPNEKKSSIYGTQLNGMLDPRIALGMSDEDYKAADTWYNEINNKLDAEISGAITRGDIAAGYRKDTGDSYSWGNELAQVMGGETTKAYKERQGAQYQYDESTISKYLQKANPELFKYYQMFTNTNDSASLNSAYTEQAYNSALARLQPQYQDNFYDNLKNQFTELSGSVAKPQQEWEAIWKKQEQDKKMNDEINAVYNNPLYQGYSRDKTIEQIKRQYAGTQMPADKLENQVSTLQYDAGIGSWSEGTGDARTYAETPDQAFQDSYFADKIGRPNEALTQYSNTRDELMQTGASQEQLDSLRMAYENTSAAYKPAQSSIPVAQGPVSPTAPVTPEPTTTALNTDLFNQFATTLDSYIKSLSPAQSKVSFSLSNNSAGDTGMRNSGLVPTTPKPFASTQSYTGKAGQSSESTTANQQALWR